MSHVLITITVSKFVSLLDAAAKRRSISSQVSFSMNPNPDDGVKLLTADGDLRVWRKGRQIRFVFADAKYRPTGISFHKTGSDSTDRYGVKNMTGREVGQDPGEPAHVGFKAMRADAGTSDERHKWEYSITFEEVATSRPGVIDPEISNTTAEDLTKKP